MHTLIYWVLMFFFKVLNSLVLYCYTTTQMTITHKNYPRTISVGKYPRFYHGFSTKLETLNYKTILTDHPRITHGFNSVENLWVNTHGFATNLKILNYKTIVTDYPRITHGFNSVENLWVNSHGFTTDFPQI